MRMNDLTVVDSIYLDAQQKEDVRRLSSLGYSSKDIAVSLGLSPEDVGLLSGMRKRWELLLTF